MVISYSIFHSYIYILNPRVCFREWIHTSKTWTFTDVPSKTSFIGQYKLVHSVNLSLSIQRSKSFPWPFLWSKTLNYFEDMTFIARKLKWKIRRATIFGIDENNVNQSIEDHVLVPFDHKISLKWCSKLLPTSPSLLSWNPSTFEVLTMDYVRTGRVMMGTPHRYPNRPYVKHCNNLQSRMGGVEIVAGWVFPILFFLC